MTTPTFVQAGAGTLNINENATATDITSLLHVSDTDATQTETWLSVVSPPNGSLSGMTANTAASGSTNITPGNIISYTPTTGYAGADSFTIGVGDGNGGSATRIINVNITPLAPSTPDLIAADDSGSSNTDNITNITTPTLSGTAYADAIVTLYDGATNLGSQIATGGSWSFTFFSPLTQGLHTFTATATVSGLISSASLGLAVTIDKAAPRITSVAIPNAAMKVGDTVTATLTVANDGGDTYTLGTSTIDGFSVSNLSRVSATSYTAQFTVTEGGTDIAAGSNIPVSLVLTDTAGNSNTAYTTAISQANDAINAHTPSNIALSSATVSTSASANAVVGALTSSDLTPSDTFTYSLVTGNGTNDADNGSFNISGGNLQATTPSSLTAGTKSVFVRTTDAGGNFFDKAISITVTASTTVLTETFSVDTGSSSTDLITNTAAQTISGTLSATTVTGETVEVSLNNGATWVTATNTIGQSTWSLAGQTLTANDTLQARVTNAGGSSTPLSRAYVLDTTPPAAPSFALTTDSGIAGDGVTNVNTITVSGVEVGATWQYSTDGGSTWSAAQTAATTTFTLTEGVHAINDVQVRQTDLAGNLQTVAAAKNAAAITIDTTPPTIPVINAVATDNIIDATEKAAGVTVTGSNETGATTTLNGQAVNQATATTWSYTLTTAAITTLGEGAKTLTAISTDLAGNTSTATHNITVNTVNAVVTAPVSIDNTYIVHNSNVNSDFTVDYTKGDQVVDSNTGTDTIISDVSYGLTPNSNVENLTLTGNAVTGYGNNLNNVITGNAMDNVINGGGGANTLIGGAGNDYYYVASANDKIVENAGEGTDIVFSTASDYTLSDNVEHLIVWGNGLNGTGNAGNNIIFGNALNNTLADGAGSDVLVGGLGQDTYNMSVDNTTDTVYICAGHSLTSSYDIVNNFNLGATGKDNLNLPNTTMPTDTTAVAGAAVGSISGASISNGIISFQGAGGAAIAANAVTLNDAIAYVNSSDSFLK